MVIGEICFQFVVYSEEVIGYVYLCVVDFGVVFVWGVVVVVVEVGEVQVQVVVDVGGDWVVVVIVVGGLIGGVQ